MNKKARKAQVNVNLDKSDLLNLHIQYISRRMTWQKHN